MIIKKISQQLQRTSAGQSIVEVLIGIMVVSVVLTTVAAALTGSIKNTSEAKFRQLATDLGQEALEMYRRERTLLGWESFEDETLPGTYCLNSLPTTTDDYAQMFPGACSGGTPIAGTEFTRQAVISIPTSNTIKIVVTVSWYDGDNQRQIILDQQFYEWQ